MSKSDSTRVVVNLRVDNEKYGLLEEMRSAGFGLATTHRNRSDVFNEVLGYGLQTHLLRREIGERNFEKLWILLNKVNWTKISLEKIEKFLG